MAILINGLDITSLCADIQSLARDVGAFQMSKFRQSGIEILQKEHDNDLVTEVDKTSEAMILKYLTSRFPDHGLMCEESGIQAKPSPWVWVIDPLDGTVNYANGLPIFAISIALRYEGESVLGVIYMPKINEMFTAIKGDGAFLNGTKIGVKKPRIWSRNVFATGFPYDKHINPLNNLDYVKHITPKIGGLRRMGAAAYDLACVAAGFLDGYWELNLKPWDYAAGVLLVKEAGGIVQFFCPSRPDSLIAGSPDVCHFIAHEIRTFDPTHF